MLDFFSSFEIFLLFPYFVFTYVMLPAELKKVMPNYYLCSCWFSVSCFRSIFTSVISAWMTQCHVLWVHSHATIHQKEFNMLSRSDPDFCLSVHQQIDLSPMSWCIPWLNVGQMERGKKALYKVNNLICHIYIFIT